MSFAGLRIGSSGLAFAQRSLETAAHNVANANTIGYSRQRVESSPAVRLTANRDVVGPGAVGQGVDITAVTRDVEVACLFREHQRIDWQMGLEETPVWLCINQR